MASFAVTEIMEKNKPWIQKQYDLLATFMEENRQQVFYLFIFYVITIALFFERFLRKFAEFVVFTGWFY